MDHPTSGQDMNHDEAAARLRQAIQVEEGSLVAMDSMSGEMGIDYQVEGGTSVDPLPHQVFL